MTLRRDIRVTSVWILGILIVVFIVSVLSCGSHRKVIIEEPWTPYGAETQQSQKETPAQPTDGPLGTIIAYDRAFSPIYFDFDKFFIRDDQRPALSDHALAFINGRADRIVTLTGHCDERGTIEYNMALGLRRAESTRRFLRDSRVTHHIVTVSYGEEKPVNEGHDEEAWAKNRRVEFKFEELK